MERHFERVISADSHVLEPTDLWWKAIGPRFGERTPRIIDEHLGRRGRFFYTVAQVLKFAPTDAHLEKVCDRVQAGRDRSGRGPAR